MKTDANWCMRIGTFVLMLIVVVAALSCGGNGSGINLPSHNQLGTSAQSGDATKEAAIVQIREDQIDTLPAWQRELLSDPGWNQPYIAPRAGTPVTPPTLQSLRDETAATMAKGVALNPRYTQSAGKGASWTGDHAGPFTTSIGLGEYDTLAPGANPPFGCNRNGSNVSPAGNAIEDLIQATGLANPTLPSYPVSYVREGLCTMNYFNTLAGANKNASAAVYQAFCSINDNSYNPASPAASAKVAEISYRSSLVPAGNPGPPTNCSATAYLVSDYFWRAFNGQLRSDQIPNGPVDVYNVLIAPSGAASADGISSGNTTGAYQPFYFGTVSGCYGGAWIVGLKSSTSSCDTFKGFFDAAHYQGAYWYNPIYGVLLQRWLDMAPVANQPWLSELGWPVYGPVGYANGAMQLNSKGTYYQWGMWFEKGFIWWVDYDQASFPTVPDEAQAYRFTGKNVYCFGESDSLVKLAPVTFYGGSGPLGVNVSVDSYRNQPADAWKPVEQDDLATEYHVGLPADDGLATVTLKMSARGYGGTPNADCKYKTYVWAFRDGTLQPAGADYSTAQMTAIHTYGDLTVNKESTYVVRVQIQDTVGFAYGDSLPIVLGTGGGGPAGEIMLIRDDTPGNIYNTNFDALTADLDAVGAAYTIVPFAPTIAADFTSGNYKVAIWYRGGPGAVGEPNYTTAWTATEEAQFNLMLQKKMLLISQAHGAVSTTWSWSYWGWDSDPDSQQCQRVNGVLMTPTTDQNMGLTSNENNGVFGWLYVMMGSEMGTGKSNTLGPQRLGLPGVFGQNAAERNLLAGSSGKLPTTMTWGSGGTDVLQFCGRGWYPPFGSSWINPGWTQGLQANPSGSTSWDDGCYGAANLSYGNTSSGGASWQTAGPGRFWCWAMPYAKLTVTGSAPAGMTRAEMLQNTLSWLDGTLTFGAAGAAGAAGWAGYDGPPEIIQVMPGYWTQTPANYVHGAVVQPGINYPDPTGTDVYKTNHVNGPGERYISTAQAGNNGPNSNDIDFQFPWYAYITTTNGVVETSPDTSIVPPALVTDDTVVFKGLLVSDSDQNWTRYTPPAGQLPNVILNYGAPVPAVAGYFTSTSGNTGDEIYASYGTGPSSLSWDNNYKLECEAIAHWPETMTYGALPAKLYWSMFPGHRMYMPGTGTFVTDSVDAWYGFRKIFDIDPNTTPAGRTTSTWNAANFAYSSLLADGRVVEFNYRTIKMWNPDLNFDNDANTPADAVADKFPIRCRLFTDYNTYIDSDPVAPGVQPYLWPNNEPPLSSYIEGGCYVTDTGDPVFPFRILDDPAQPDPQNSIAGSTGNYAITFKYILKYGVAPYASVKVEFDPVFNHTWGNPGSYVYTLATNVATSGPQSNVLTLDGTPGHVAPPDGNYWITLQGIDGDSPAVTSYYYYSGSALALFPQFKVVILKDPMSQAPAGRDVSKLQADLGFLYGASSVVTIDLGTTTLTSHQLDGSDAVIWLSDQATSNGGASYNVPSKYTAGAGNANINEVQRAHQNPTVAGGTTVVMMGQYAMMNSQADGAYPTPGAIRVLSPFPDTGDYNWFYWFGSFPGAGMDNAWQFYAPYSTTPNNLGSGGGWTGSAAWEATSIGWHCPGIFGIGGEPLKNSSDPSNYSAGGSLASGYYTNYYGAYFVRRSTPAGANAGGQIILFPIDYGDLMGTMPNAVTRSRVLENMLCCGQSGSKFNSPNT